MKLSLILMILGLMIMAFGCHSLLWLLVGGLAAFSGWIRAEVRG